MADPPVDAPPSDNTVSSLENAISTTDSPMLSSDNINLYDETYSSLRSHFLMDGRGRRPHLPCVFLSNRVMLQLSSLKDEANVTWDTVLTWFLKLFPEQVLTAGQWLSKKKTKEAIHLLSVARKHRGKIRRRSRDEERDVRRLVKERIEENEKRKKEKELRDRERHLEIVNAVVAQGGLCVDRADVDRLMEERNRVENLKAQIRYRKVILKEKNLSLTSNYSQLYQCLISCLEDESQGPPRKRVRK